MAGVLEGLTWVVATIAKVDNRAEGRRRGPTRARDRILAHLRECLLPHLLASRPCGLRLAGKARHLAAAGTAAATTTAATRAAANAHGRSDGRSSAAHGRQPPPGRRQIGRASC